MKDLPLNWIKILEKLWIFTTYIVAVLVIAWLFYFFKTTLNSDNPRLIKLQQAIMKAIE